MGRQVIFVLADGFEELELTAPADILKRMGCNVVFAGLNSIEVTGAHGFRYVADMLLREADAVNADAVILPGGMPGSRYLLESKALAEILRIRDSAGRLCAAICAAPAVLEHAGIVRGRTITGYPGCEQLSGSDSCRFSGAMTERDGNLVTAKGPGAACLFGLELARALALPEDAINQVKNGMFL